MLFYVLRSQHTSRQQHTACSCQCALACLAAVLGLGLCACRLRKRGLDTVHTGMLLTSAYAC